MLPYGVNDNVLLTRVLDETEIINMILSTTNPSAAADAAAAASSSIATNHKDDDNLNHKVIKDDNNNHLISVENKIPLVHTDGGNDINTIIDYKSTSPVLRSSMKNFSDINDNNKQIKEKEVTMIMIIIIMVSKNLLEKYNHHYQHLDKQNQIIVAKIISI